MALIIEDGTGVPGAESYVSVNEFDAYTSRMGHSEDVAIAAASELKKEAMLRRSAIFLDGVYGIRIAGVRKNPDQGLIFPQVGAFYLDGRAINPDSVPQAWKDAQCEAAVLGLQGTSLVVTAPAGGRLKRKRTDVLEKEWFEDSMDSPAIFGWLDAILAGILAPLDTEIGFASIRRA